MEDFTDRKKRWYSLCYYISTVIWLFIPEKHVMFFFLELHNIPNTKYVRSLAMFLWY